ncbi:MAG: type II toxin-antitoxin system VapC family toxin [Steroidobacteraceae bacterium]
MRVLLDTHVLLWALGSPSKLSAASRKQIESAEVFVSAASVCEISIKHSLGKLQADPREVVGSGGICTPADHGRARRQDRRAPHFAQRSL